MKHAKIKLLATCLSMSLAGNAVSQTRAIFNQIKPPKPGCELPLEMKEAISTKESLRELSLVRLPAADQIIIGEGMDKALQLKRSKGIAALPAEVEQCIKQHGASKYCLAIESASLHLTGTETGLQNKPMPGFFNDKNNKNRIAAYKKTLSKSKTFIDAALYSADYVSFMEYLPNFCSAEAKSGK